jgi:hypothetical protein
MVDVGLQDLSSLKITVKWRVDGELSILTVFTGTVEQMTASSEIFWIKFVASQIT